MTVKKWAGDAQSRKLIFGACTVVALSCGAPLSYAQDAKASVSYATPESITPVPPICTETTLETCLTEDGDLMIFMGGSLRLNPVDVWGDRTLEQPGSFSALYSDAIEAIGADHPAEILNQAPGVNVQMNSGQEHLISLRSPVLTGGSGQGSFLILENGVPTRASAFGNVNALLEPHHEIAEAIEVVRGPASAKYGSNAVHGLFNFILPYAGGDPELTINASASTLNRYKTDLIARGETASFGGFAALSLVDDTGWRDNSGLEQQKASALAEFELGQFDVTAWANYSNLNQETAGFIQGVDAYKDETIASSNPNPEAFRDATSARAAMRLEQEFDFGTLIITPYARSQDMTFLMHFLAWQPLEKNGHDSVGIFASMEQPMESVVVRYGTQLEWADGYLRETQSQPFGFFPGDSRFPVGVHYDYTVETQLAALWGEVEWQVSDRVSVLGGLRAETHRYDYQTDAPIGINGRFNVPGDREDSFDLFTPKFGVIWEANDDITLFANYARGERAPQATDLYRLQNNQAVGEIEVETLDSFEIGARGFLFEDRFVYDVAAYTMEKDNFFFRDAQGLNVIDGKTEHLGVEVDGTFYITETLILSGQLSWSDQTYAFDRAANGIVSGNRIDTAPEWLGDLSLEWRNEKGAEVSLSAEFIGEYFTDPANSRTYPGHTVFTARGAYPVTDTLEVYAIARNLFDTRYADRADFAFGNERYFPGEPANLTIGFRKKITQ